MAIFKAYDIRGTVPDQLNPEIAYRIGRGVGSFLGGAAPIAVGWDARPHSGDISRALIRGINDEGVDVYELGAVSTPMLYFGVDDLGAAGGVMVTASHNPAEYNGFKVCREHAIPVGQDTGLRDIERLSEERADAPVASARGSSSVRDILAGYVRNVRSVGTDCPELRVAIDCGNGMAGVALEPLLDELPLQVERLYFEPDGTFPNHEADPLKVENLKEVADAVKRTGADFGLAFDGDGDRAIFVDEQGEPIGADLMTGILARYQLQHAPGSKVLYDLRSSRVVAEEIEKAGGVPEMCRVGHSFVKAQMRDSGAIFAGELSGHIYFRFSDTLVADDGTAAFVALLEVMAREGKPLSEIVAPLRRYFATGEINRKVADAAGLIEKIRSEHEDAPLVSDLDGLLVRYDDWWFNLRPSNTEPVLRLNLEADTRERMEEERDRLIARMERGE